MNTLHIIFLVCAYSAALGFLVIGIDDLFFDLQFLRYLSRRKGKQPVSIQELKSEPEQRIAIFVPAWMEGDIVSRMAEYATRVLIYDRYDIFVGVYPNDPATGACVDHLAASCPRIRKVVVPSEGPTSKADCLNALYKAMRAREVSGRMEYSIIALHDSEDILHPLTLKVYNYHVPRFFDMGQIPVFPLELTPWKYWIGNTYMDEFSEWHLKDMYSREVMGGVVPSAGVGTAITRKALDFLAARHEGGPFVVGHLAEDYMMGLELCREGFRAGFIDYPVEREIHSHAKDGKAHKTQTVTERVAVRENFPTRFYQAVKQKARWIVGTAFQGWEHGGWWGSAAVRYTLLRDRRAPLVHCVNAAGYGVMLYVAAEFALLHSEWRNVMFLKPIFTADSLLWRIVLLDIALLGYRIAQKVFFVSEVYGFRHALFAIPRYPIGNFLNMAATFRAGWLYLQHRVFLRPLAWVKTSHEFPGVAELSEFSRSIEDLLVEEGVVSRPDLEEILATHAGLSAPGALLRIGLIDEEQFTDLWARFSGVAPRVAVPAEVAGVEHWPETEAVLHDAMPVVAADGAGLECLFLEPPGEETIRSVEATLGRPVRARLVRPSNLLALRHSVYPSLVTGHKHEDPFASVVLSLDPPAARQVEEFAAIRHRSLADALISLNYLSDGEARTHLALHLGVEPADIGYLPVDCALADALGPLFCETHAIVPFTGKRLAISAAPPPEVIARVREIVGTEALFCADAPPAFHKAWQRFLRFRLSETRLLDYLLRERLLSAEDAAHIREMQLLIASPADSLLLQLGIITGKQLSDALEATSGLHRLERRSRRRNKHPSTRWQPSFFQRDEVSRSSGWTERSEANQGGVAASPSALGVLDVLPQTLPPRSDGQLFFGGDVGRLPEELLAPGFSGRSGIRVVSVTPGLAVLALSNLPSASDLAEARERCTGIALKFELEARP